jgi:hypothetical protein
MQLSVAEYLSPRAGAQQRMAAGWLSLAQRDCVKRIEGAVGMRLYASHKLWCIAWFCNLWCTIQLPW